MQIILNDQGYIESYALIGGLVDGVEIEVPDELLEDFKQHPEAYKLDDGVLVLDADKLKADADAAELTVIRRRRETECFAYINRGELWYSLLTDEPKSRACKLVSRLARCAGDADNPRTAGVAG